MDNRESGSVSGLIGERKVLREVVKKGSDYADNQNGERVGVSRTINGPLKVFVPGETGEDWRSQIAHLAWVRSPNRIESQLERDEDLAFYRVGGKGTQNLGSSDGSIIVQYVVLDN